MASARQQPLGVALACFGKFARFPFQPLNCLAGISIQPALAVISRASCSMRARNVSMVCAPGLPDRSACRAAHSAAAKRPPQSPLPRAGAARHSSAAARALAACRARGFGLRRRGPVTQARSAAAHAPRLPLASGGYNNIPSERRRCSPISR